jgi:PKHD-type hydroxylase
MSYNYKGITNNVYERSRIIYPYCWWDGVFTNEELDQISDFLSREGMERAKTLGQDTANLEIEISKPQSSRKSKIRFYGYDQNTSWFFDKLNYTIDMLNARFYNFDLNGYDYVQYTEYYDHENGKYDFHMDTIMESKENIDSEMRKLSITMLLNDPEKDFDGGEFEINTGGEKDAIKVDAKKGRIIAFPSFMIHRVAPVLRGTRKSLVIWVLGPKFR